MEETPSVALIYFHLTEIIWQKMMPFSLFNRNNLTERTIFTFISILFILVKMVKPVKTFMIFYVYIEDWKTFCQPYFLSGNNVPRFPHFLQLCLPGRERCLNLMGRNRAHMGPRGLESRLVFNKRVLFV